MSNSTLKLIESSKLIKQGAEAKIYVTTLHPNEPPILLKHRFSKKYRHAALDSSLTRARVAGEARAILRCLRSEVRVPGIRMVDAEEGVLGLELIDGKAVRQILPGGGDDDDGEFGVTHDEIMTLIGTEIAKMHLANVIHGDLTTSNMMLRRRPPNCHPPAEIVLIDFGLTSTSGLPEDKAVDLYVLERAFSSTHPDSEPLFQSVLNAYAAGSGKAWEAISRRLDEVRLRGRKRSMVG
ncbi:hypothetical protein BS47DRAFT_1372903 [Hydnum rufescens UP504]|uniref:non-specific serine/threonine protein kinase n=1 Tax=Hydnum rufescens UP504 TaxID=1448309 RepID=A0A9P6DUV7_9AGAM|nr:hypothetical protein BS47DRAFT_1372903 [Hydnum rufescens UP504]